ncbi:putative urease accessory protein [Actinoplanes missouriensis 431]|uniref:Urease accessory protein UreD n=1 Tax=Actinoplanes missouriensis (strain ATCC 14538 / DSM 43046 / CBS 188.64 / JCM 3121 / NBRC 102363 / NCIMB 12654 / NRRL B-3342 / UNCC 431) TaxID=512565 RepID=I0HEP4_ACTM4|nr:urease accessory protein UreD [Actinoplanes missouriensis]BAL91481.1 putative urease accessory protein [Actinoplanes missouriensis 431]
MRAEARVVACSDGSGGTRLDVLRGESPLLLRRTGPRAGAGVTVHLVGGAAGPLRGDELRLEIEVGPGAWLEFRSVAASLALPGRSFLPASRLTVTATVAPGGTLRYLPEPLIAAAGCDHVAITRVDVAEGGSLLWRDDLVCGRHREESGDVRAGMTVRYGGTTVYRHELSVGPGAPGWAGAAVLGEGRAIGTVVAVGPESAVIGPGSGAGQEGATQPASGSGGTGVRADRKPGGDAAVMGLARGGVLVSAVGADSRQVAAALDPWCARDPRGAGGSPPVPRDDPRPALQR